MNQLCFLEIRDHKNNAKEIDIALSMALAARRKKCIVRALRAKEYSEETRIKEAILSLCAKNRTSFRGHLKATRKP